MLAFNTTKDVLVAGSFLSWCWVSVAAGASDLHLGAVLQQLQDGA
jgi:hypothetical protein